jgi:hypothetical protein
VLVLLADPQANCRAIVSMDRPLGRIKWKQAATGGPSRVHGMAVCRPTLRADVYCAGRFRSQEPKIRTLRMSNDAQIQLAGSTLSRTKQESRLECLAGSLRKKSKQPFQGPPLFAKHDEVPIFQPLRADVEQLSSLTIRLHDHTVFIGHDTGDRHHFEEGLRRRNGGPELRAQSLVFQLHTREISQQCIAGGQGSFGQLFNWFLTPAFDGPRP